MRWFLSIFIALTFISMIKCDEDSLIQQEMEAKKYVEDNILAKLQTEIFVVNEANWVYESNITDETEELKSIAAAKFAKWLKDSVVPLTNYKWNNFTDKDLKRKIKKLVKLGDAFLPQDKFKELEKIVTDMDSNYATTKIESFRDKSQQLSLEPEISEILTKSRDSDELKYYWVEWHDKAGTVSKNNFFKYAALKNEAARLNNFTSQAEFWLDEYEDDTFEKQIEDILEQMTPLYKQLHAYIRYQLHQQYGDKVDLKKPIPMHLLGNMWAQTWDEIADILVPYPQKPILDVTDEMVKQGYTAIKMFEMGDEFFQSLNMTKLPESFWKKSLLVKPDDDRDLVCHASAWDFGIKVNGQDDVRIKQCTTVTMNEFLTVHHELGHIQYYLQYAHQSPVYRDGANPGFHEAIGDVLSLSVSTPKHLEKVGLLKDFVFDKEAKVNQLVRMGAEKIAFLPFAFVMDKFRWEVFRGNIKPDTANCKFWEMRVKYSGVEPPVFRNNEDFDPPAKYHVSADVEYLRYFVSYITQFQFYKAACEKAGEFKAGDPEKQLINCDIYQSTEAGNLFKSMLELGSTKPWPDAMEVMTGQRKMDAGALLEYFKPLQDWLEAKNKELNVHIGWDNSDKYSCESKVVDCSP